MAQLSGHRRLGAYEDRRLHCQFALEPIFDNVTRLALASGWNEDDVAYALFELARSNIKEVMKDRAAESEASVTASLVAAALK